MKPRHWRALMWRWRLTHRRTVAPFTDAESFSTSLSSPSTSLTSSSPSAVLAIVTVSTLRPLPSICDEANTCRIMYTFYFTRTGSTRMRQKERNTVIQDNNTCTNCTRTKLIFQDFPGPGNFRKKYRTIREAWEPDSSQHCYPSCGYPC